MTTDEVAVSGISCNDFYDDTGLLAADLEREGLFAQELVKESPLVSNAFSTRRASRGSSCQTRISSFSTKEANWGYYKSLASVWQLTWREKFYSCLNRSYEFQLLSPEVLNRWVTTKFLKAVKSCGSVYFLSLEKCSISDLESGLSAVSESMRSYGAGKAKAILRGFEIRADEST